MSASTASFKYPESRELDDLSSKQHPHSSASTSSSLSPAAYDYPNKNTMRSGGGGGDIEVQRREDDEDEESEDGMEWESPSTEVQHKVRATQEYEESRRGRRRSGSMGSAGGGREHHPSRGNNNDGRWGSISSSTGSANIAGGAGGRSRRYANNGSDESKQRRSIWWRHAATNVIYILAWYLFSTLISVYNKWMFSPEHYNFPYPLFVTSIHMLIQWLLSSLTLATFKGLRSNRRPSPPDYLSKVVPCGIATGLDIGLSNLSLRTITLSFYTMCKSSSLAFVLIFAFIFQLETPSWRLVGIILVITSGVVLMVSTETQFNATGMIEVLSASALGGLRWSLIQILLDKESMGMSNPFATLFWLAPIMGATLALCSIVFEGWGNVFGSEIFFGSWSRSLSTFGAILFPGMIAFCMNVTEFGLIQRTSVVTLSVAGIFKEVAVIFMSTVIFHDQLTPINISGLIVTLSGIGLYNYLKYNQFTSPSPPSPLSTSSPIFTSHAHSSSTTSTSNHLSSAAAAVAAAAMAGIGKGAKDSRSESSALIAKHRRSGSMRSIEDEDEDEDEEGLDDDDEEGVHGGVVGEGRILFDSNARSKEGRSLDEAHTLHTLGDDDSDDENTTDMRRARAKLAAYNDDDDEEAGSNSSQVTIRK